jgi:palmitoyltransferase ZDHHC13/17
MQALSVTGATLVEHPVPRQQQCHDSSHDHSSHSHSHEHDAGHTNHNHNNVMSVQQQQQQQQQQQHLLPTIQLKKPAKELVAEYNDTQMMTMVHQIVRLGSYDLLQDVILAWRTARPDSVKHNLHSYDEAGHTLTHWAAKRIDDVRFITYFLNDELVPFFTSSSSSSDVDDHQQPHDHHYESPLHRPTLDDTKMTPVHWVCTIGGRGAIAILQTMLSSSKSKKQEPWQHSILEVRDGTQCTPVLIAAQHGHVDTCAFLIQKGADFQAVDISRDTATHWAAYKGSELVLGLLSFYDIRPLTQPDAYGQTPLHLAALRGHAGTVRYIMQQLSSSRSHQHQQQYRPDDTTRRGPTIGGRSHGGGITTVMLLKDVLQLKDSNGRTPYELAVFKQQHHVAELLQQTMHPNIRQYLSWRTLQSWLGLTESSHEESPKLPYYYVWFQIGLHVVFLFGVFLPIFNTGDGVLWDYLGLLVCQLSLMIGIVYVLHQTTFTNPGRLDPSHPAYTEYRKLYELAIGGGLMNNDDDDDPNSVTEEVQLCHSCHIARPLRSKHCRITGTCVLAFDHHCPFVGATVGLYNVRLVDCCCLLLFVVVVWVA